MNIYSIADKLDVSWHPEVVSVVESWSDYSNLELEEFRKAVFVKGINHAKASRAKGWVFDGSQATGSFSDEVQAMIAQDRFPALGWAGVQYYVNIDPAVTEISVTEGSEATRNVKRVEAPSVEAALAWLKEQG